MKSFGIAIAVTAIICILILLITYICFYIVFYVPRRKPSPKEEYPIPPGKIYEPFRDIMIGWIKEARSMTHEKVSIVSFDGLTLYGKYYEYAPGAPIELMLHGYRGDAERDLCGGVQRCFACGRSALIVDQRACGSSEGNIITFGIREYRDCLSWIDFMLAHFGSDVKIILTGISMGASTVMIAAGRTLPPNVIGALADCGFTSAPDIIKKVIRQLHIPVGLLYPFIKLSAKLFAHIDLEEVSPIEAVKKCTVPLIFFHGESDDYVPCEMSRLNYEACTAPKRLVTVPGAGHGLSYPVDPEGYSSALKEFFEPEAGTPSNTVDFLMNS